MIAVDAGVVIAVDADVVIAVDAGVIAVNVTDAVLAIVVADVNVSNDSYEAACISAANNCFGVLLSEGPIISHTRWIDKLMPFK